MDISLIPARPGQICKIVSDMPDKESDQVYIIAEDPAGFGMDEEIEVVELKELQRNIKNPGEALREPVQKNQLVVISENLESYISTWNEQ